MEILFACDLDNTLIHSYKRRREGDICVEIYDGHEQSFISPRAIGLLKKIAAQVIFIPITTRSIEQYRRIFWTENFSPQYAVVANGAYILEGGVEKNLLHDEILTFADEMERQQKIFSADENFTICRIVDESFLFLRCRDDVDVDSLTFETTLTVQRTGKKIYLFPPLLTKGNALRRLIEKFSPTKIFAAGDSKIDLSMLEIADVAFAPKSLGKFLTCADAPDFAENFLQRISKNF